MYLVTGRIDMYTCMYIYTLMTYSYTQAHQRPAAERGEEEVLSATQGAFQPRRNYPWKIPR